MITEGNTPYFPVCPEGYDLSGKRQYNNSNFREHPQDPGRFFRFTPKTRISYYDSECDFSVAEELFSDLAQFSIDSPHFTVCEATIEGREYFVQDTERIDGVDPLVLLRKLKTGDVDPAIKQRLALATSQLCSSLTRYLTDRAGSSKPFLSEIYRLDEQYLFVDDRMVLVDIDPIVATLDHTSKPSQAIFLSKYLGDIAGMINSAELFLGVSFEQSRSEVVNSILELKIAPEALRSNSSASLNILLEKSIRSRRV